MTEPRPYTPPDTQPSVPGPVRSTSREWPRDEIDEHGRSKLYHQCYRRCGFSSDDFAELNAHEDNCHG